LKKYNINPTGARDVFTGVYTSVLNSDGTYQKVLVQASAMASSCVEGFGVEKMLECTKAEITKRVSFLNGTLDL